MQINAQGASFCDRVMFNWEMSLRRLLSFVALFGLIVNGKGQTTSFRRIVHFADARTNAERGHTNRLANEKSPYLLQHAHNPVDWFAWGDEAFAKARREDKPVLLSIGYSTCHWCHVM